MNAGALLDHLRTRGVSVVAEDGRLRVVGSKDALSDTVKRDIAAHKEALLALLGEPWQSHAPTPVAREGRLSLSLFQERLWVLQRLEPESTAYNISTLWRLTHGWSMERAATVLLEIVSRHEILRSIFRDDDGTPNLTFASPESVAIRQTDLSGWADEARQQCILDAARRAVTEPFDLTVAPPIRFHVFGCGQDEVAVVVVVHHIAVDDWSLTLLRQEVDALGSGGAVPPPSLQYLDYAVWQRRIQDTPATAQNLTWWEQRLHGLPQLCAFPADLKSSGAAKGETYCFEAGSEVLGPLKALVHEHRATLYTALLAACAAVLRVHAAQDDIVIGCPMAVRERPEFEAMVGPFINLLVLRLDLSDDPSFATLLGRARDAVLDAHEHKDAPFETLVRRLNPSRSLDHSPLFQVSLVLHNSAADRSDMTIGGGAIQDFTWFARENNGSLQCSIEYRSDLYSTAMIARIADHLRTMLAAAARDPAAPISTLSVLTQAERDRLLMDFAGTRRVKAADPFIIGFERWAAAAPDRTAVTFEGENWTYGDLDRRANRIARRLRDMGVRQGLVGVLLERGPDLVATLLAVQKAGCAYVPLDANFPPQRLAFMLEDSCCTALVVDAETAHLADSNANRIVLDLRSDHALSNESEGPLGMAPQAEDLAYVIYTSGSTGRPNGVRISHGSLANFLTSMSREPGLGENDVLAALTTVSFDIAGLEIYLPLLVGAQIDLVSREVASNGILLAEHLASSAATVVQATPATFRMLVDAGWTGSPKLRAFCGGEALPYDLAHDVLDRVSCLWNLYGPTETTVWSSAGQVGIDRPIDVGRPIDNTSIYILDRNRALVPIGVAGEIWIGGKGVALGYNDRAELTADRFVADPFSAEPGRMYKTGDLGRWGEDGRLYHLGRLDHQVKVRGFRIELGEIEAALSAHPKIRQARVVARVDQVGAQRLVAYLVHQTGQELTPSESRRFLRQRLPDYMIPSLFVALNSFTLTPNGKIDTAALPDPFLHVHRSNEFRAPSAGLEALLAEIWRDVLGIQKVSANDNFYEIGGYSLLSLQVAGRVRERTGWRIDPRALFFQTLGQLAATGSRELGERP